MRSRTANYPSADSVSWTLIGGLALGCLLLGTAIGFEILPWRAVLCGTGLATLAGALAIGRIRADARLVGGATAFLQMTSFTVLGVVLTFGLAARAGPLWDVRLAAADQRLGFDWPAIFEAADRIPAPLLAVGGVAYYSLVAQMVLCIVVLAATRRLQRLRVVVAAAVLSGTVTVLISGIVPALGNLFDPERYRVLWPSIAWQEQALVLGLRDGSVRQLDMLHLTGIVSFPSYHATLPVILAWGLYPIARLRLPAAAWATLTIAATPLFGGHYFVDVLGGIVFAVAALAIASRLPSGNVESNGVFRQRRHAIRPPSPVALQRGLSRNGRLRT